MQNLEAMYAESNRGGSVSSLINEGGQEEVFSRKRFHFQMWDQKHVRSRAGAEQDRSDSLVF